MSELKDGKLSRSPDSGRWVVDLLWLDDDGVWQRRHTEFDSQRQAMGMCEMYGMKLPLPTWIHAVRQEPAEDPADNMVAS